MTRRRWISAGALLVAVGAMSAVSTWRHWSGCRPDPESPRCHYVHEQTYGLPLWGTAPRPDAVGSAIVATAALLLALSWLMVSGWARRSAARTAMAVIVAAQPVTAAVLVAVELIIPGRSTLIVTQAWLSLPAEVLVFPLLLGAGWILEEPPRETFRLIVLAWGVTSFGSLHHFVDYVVSMMLWPGSADSPAGLGYVTALTQIVLGSMVCLSSLRGPGRTDPEEDERRGRDGFTLAA